LVFGLADADIAGIFLRVSLRPLHSTWQFCRALPASALNADRGAQLANAKLRRPNLSFSGIRLHLVLAPAIVPAKICSNLQLVAAIWATRAHGDRRTADAI
jgi:hypothetical protein